MVSNNSYVYISSVILAYWVVSISMVYMNKALVSNEEASIPAPLFVTWFQCLMTCVICVTLGTLGDITRSSGEISFLNEFPLVNFDYVTALKVLPLSLVFVGMIALNNLCLQMVHVSFYNVARCLSLVFNVIFSYLLLGKTTNAATNGTLVVVITGFICGIDGELGLTISGVITGVVASIFVALNIIYTAKTLPLVDGDKSQLMFYNNFNALFLFIPLLVLFELDVIIAHKERLTSTFFWTCMILAGFMGFAIGLVTVMQVKATSPLTHNISGSVKAAFQSLLAFYVWGNKCTVLGIIGIFLVIMGSGLYTCAQINGTGDTNPLAGIFNVKYSLIPQDHGNRDEVVTNKNEDSSTTKVVE